MQAKYIEQFNDLYPDFHLTKIPLMSQEVRHINKLKMFAHLLLNPYQEEYDKDDFDEAHFFKDFDKEHQDENADSADDAEQPQHTKDILDID